MPAMNYADETWSSQNGNIPAQQRDRVGLGQRAQFQGVVVPINAGPVRDNAAFQTNHQVPATYIANNVHYIDPRSLTTSQPAHPNSVPANGVLHAQNSISNPQVTTDRQVNTNQPLDYQLLLLSLAEDYFTAAQIEGSNVALFRREIEMQRYYKLLATGLGCLEAVLKVSTKDSPTLEVFDSWL